MRSFKKKMLMLLFGATILFAPGISGAQQKTFGEELTEIFQEFWQNNNRYQCDDKCCLIF